MVTKQEWYVLNDDVSISMAADTTREAQTFTIGTTGNNIAFELAQVRVKLVKAAGHTEDFDWRLTSCQPNGLPDYTDVLSTGTLANADVSTTAKWVTITMTAVTLQRDTQYALIFEDGYDTANAKASGWACDETAPAYTGGNRYESTDSGVVWDTYAHDFMFQIEGGSYGGTLCTYGDATNKAGTNAAAVAKEEIVVSDYVKQVEGIICALTRYNWVAAYSGLHANVKYLLNDLASNLAAIYMITSDMSNYTDRVEAETMINVYRDASLRIMSLLRNQEVKSFITGVT